MTGEIEWTTGMVRRPVTRPAPQPARVAKRSSRPLETRTHILRVIDPDTPANSWKVDISVVDDDQALARMRQLASWVFPPHQVLLHAADRPSKSLGGMVGFRSR